MMMMMMMGQQRSQHCTAGFFSYTHILLHI